MSLLPQDTILKIAQAAIETGLDRNREPILSALDNSIVASIPLALDPRSQVITDLNHLNRIGVLDEGNIPLRTWLKIAHMLSISNRASSVFEDAIEELDAILLRENPTPADFSAEVAPQDDALDYDLEAQPWYRRDFPRVTGASRRELQELSERVDVLLMTTVPVERDAVLKLMKPLESFDEVIRGFVDSETYLVGRLGSYSTALTMCDVGSIGRGSVTMATQAGIQFWQPAAVLMVGIAMGRDRISQHIGDVLIATQIAQYERQQHSKMRTIQRGPVVEPGLILLNRFRDIRGWRFERPDGYRCRPHLGQVLSGEKIIDRAAAREALFGQYPSAIGAEMEGAGLYTAAERTRTEWLLIKAISNWGDGRNNDASRLLAAASAASLVEHVLDQEYVLDELVSRRFPQQQQKAYEPRAPLPNIDPRRDQALEALQNMIPPIFAEVVFRLNIPRSRLPGSSAPQADQAMALIEYMETETDDGMDELSEVIRKVRKRYRRS